MSLLQTAEPLIDWSHVGLELLNFAGTLALYGATGFGLVGPGASSDGIAAPAVPAPAARRAAVVGLIGGVLSLLSIAAGTAARAAEKGETFAAAFAAGGPLGTARLAFVVLALLGFGLARAGRRAGWWIALAATLALALRSIARGTWTALVNPLHVLAAGLWIGTLFVLVVAVFPVALRGELPAGRGGALVAAVVSRFSRLALLAAGLLGLTGVVTAWRHLKYVAALWTTPYGWALLVKLALVATVVAVGAFNWRRVTPGLGTDDGTRRLDRSARTELAVAGLVLLVTAVLVSLPAPRLPGAPPGH